MEIHPIRTEADYRAALRAIDALMADDPEPDSPAGAQLDALVTLVQAYEARHHPIDPPDPVEAIKFRMEQAGLTARDLEPLIGRRHRVYEILNRKRALTLPMIRRLHRGLGIPAEALIADPAPAP